MGSNKGRKSTREAGKKQGSNKGKPAVVNKVREAGKKQGSNKGKPAVVNKVREAGKKQGSNKSKKQVRFNENLQETRYFYKNDPSQRMLKQNEFLNELQNK